MVKKRLVLRLLDSLAMLAFIATFTPLVMPKNELSPALFGIPYTMWMGLLVSIFFVILAYLVSLLNKEKTNAD